MDKFSRILNVTSVSGLLLMGLLQSGQASAEPVSAMVAPPKAALQSLAEPMSTAIRRPLLIKGYKTHSNSKILFIQTNGLPMFDVHVSFAAGSAHTAYQPGLAGLTFSLLTEGVEGKDVNAILETFDSLGAKLGMDITPDRASFSLRSLSDEARRTPALELFTQLLGEPSLSEHSLPVVKSELLRYLDQEEQSYTNQTDSALDGLLFPGHGYAQSIYGTKSGLASITRAQTQAFHREAYAAGNAVITLVGDLSEDEAQRIGAQISNALPQAPAIAALTAPARPATSSSPLRIERPSVQAHLRLAQPGVLRGSPDFLALRMASQIFTARLMKELRERRGLTYDAQATLSALQAQGTLVIELQTRPELADAVLARIKDMFRDYLAHGPTQEELDDLHLRLTGSAPLQSSSNALILRQLHNISINNLPLELDFSTQQALKLDLDSVKSALNQHFNAEQWQAVILGPKTDQQPLPSPVESEANALCRASDEFVAS